MADTPRGPRPTRTRLVVRLLVGGWLCVLALAAVAAVAPRALLEDGWSRERVPILKLPYAECNGGERCTMRPTVELPNGSSATPKLTIRHPDELLPSKYFRLGGTMLLWISDGDDPQLRSVRPISDSGRAVSIGAVVLAVLLAAALIEFSRRAPRLHDERNAGHISDHVAVWVLPATVAVTAVVLITMHLAWRTPKHEPIKPPQPPSLRS